MHYNGDMFWISSLFAKIIYFLITTFKLGNGFTWPGHIVNKVFPNIWCSPTLQSFKGVVFISGTNGKTTTAKLITHLLKEQGFSVVTNASGANLVNGVLTSLLLNTSFFRGIKADYAVFEIDELNLPLILAHLTPDFLVLTNLSRDQLDRYGEVDTILDLWQTSIERLDTTIVINEAFEFKEKLLSGFGGEVLFYNDSPEYLSLTPLVGNFNALNVNAGVLVAEGLGLDLEKIKASLADFEPAFGRGEVIKYGNSRFLVFLAKNPASFNNNLKMLLQDSLISQLPTSQSPQQALLFILNDNIPDGRDVSWIYDVEPDLLQKVCDGRKVYVAGSRCLDMQIRLFYAGIPCISTGSSSVGVLEPLDISALQGIPEKEIVVLPNYSAMLEFRKLVTGNDIL